MLINRTIDDEYNDLYTSLLPDYSPVNGWIQGATCEGCGIGATDSSTSRAKIVDVTRVYNKTWHDSTYLLGELERSITVSFTGRAVYVFKLIANTVPSISTFTALDFYLDDSFVDTYYHRPNRSTGIVYDVPVYVNTTLANGPHTLVISTAARNVSLVLFDYMIYTAEQDERPTQQSTEETTQISTIGPSTRDISLQPSTPSKSTLQTATHSADPRIASSYSPSVAPTQASSRDDASGSRARLVGSIVGDVTGGVVALLLVILFLHFFKRHRRKPSTAPIATQRPSDPLSESASDQTPQLSYHSGAAPDASCPVAIPPATARSRSEFSLARPSRSSRSLLQGMWPFNTVATLHSAVVALRDEVAMLRAEGVDVQRRPDTPPPRYEPPPQARKALELWT
ncbi:hypothetical protein C8Q73DRAFT_681994 [Cubamyces lactineus]|nr:hypothetical protein C8Q73DRAFT_681994 [Cubamyces lactineus]